MHADPAYTPTTFAKEEIMNKYRSVLSAVKAGLQNYSHYLLQRWSESDLDLVRVHAIKVSLLMQYNYNVLFYLLYAHLFIIQN